MNRITLVIGSNHGERKQNVTSALEWLESFTLVACSNIYETPDFLGTGTTYWNAVAEIETETSQEELTQLIKRYERDCGRTKEMKELGLITIDIDIVMVNGVIVRKKDYDASFFKQGYRELMHQPRLETR